jgi:hypothetical protein
MQITKSGKKGNVKKEIENLKAVLISTSASR